MNKNRGRISDILNIAVFFAFLIILCLATIFAKKENFSELENRYLADTPAFSVKSWFSGDYSDGLSEYSREQFTLRTRWIAMRTKIERFLGKSAINGVYFANGRLCEIAEKPDYDRIDRSIAAINSFGEELGGRLSVMIVPTSAQIYADSLPSYSPEQEQRKLINYVNTALVEGIQPIDVYDSLMRAREDYIYYRTDHHWTAYGAYVAYCECVRRLGYSPVTLDNITVEHASRDFLGSYYSKVLTDEVEPDTIDFYTSGGAQVTGVRVTKANGEVVERDSVYFRENLEKKDKYQSFLGENVPLVEIESSAGGGSILIIKDSYANSFVPFLSKHFSKVTAVDLRYMMRLEDYVDPTEYDRILILYNASTFSEDTNLVKLFVKNRN